MEIVSFGFVPGIKTFRDDPQQSSGLGDAPLVGISHGVCKPEQLSKYNFHKFLVVHSGTPASEEDVSQIKSFLKEEERSRVFSLTTGWNKLAPKCKADIVDFLKSDKLDPENDELRRLLGFDTPVRKLALLLALEIVKDELSIARSKQTQNANQASIEVLLSPALQLARDVEQWRQIVEPVKQAMNERKMEDLIKAIDAALIKFRNPL
jgi:hypothetical protein